MKEVGAGRGRRSPKSGQSNYFVGFKKHTISMLAGIEGRWWPIPVGSLARPAGKADVEMLKPLLNHVRRRLRGIVELNFVVGDKGYVSADRSRFLREHWGVGLVVSPKPDMRPPTGTNAAGCPLCPCGAELIWVDYDATDGRLIYQGASETCVRCPLSGTCAKQFEFPASGHETYWGMIPSHSKLSRKLMRQFRPRTEPGFNIVKHRFRLSDFFINSLDLAKMLCTMSDIIEVLKIIGQEGLSKAPQSKKEALEDIKQLEFWDLN